MIKGHDAFYTEIQATMTARTPAGSAMKWIEANASHDGDVCLCWPFFRLPDGRPHMTRNRKTARPPRVMCEVAHGPPPSPKHQAAHSCGNAHGGCMNPRHLRWATAAENNAEKKVHGTQRVGEMIWCAKYTEDTVRAIRAASKKELASVRSALGVSVGAAKSMRRRLTWKHI